jgi:GNAT superfamily N-acetyltransferase
MAGEINVRPALLIEREALEALQLRASLANPGDRDALLANLDAIELPSSQIEEGQVLVAEVNGTVVGFASILPRPDGDTELDALFVEPQLWRSGIGSALIDKCIDAAKAAGSAALHVIGNPHAMGFYRSRGFIVIGTTATRFGDGQLYRRSI